MDSWLHHVPKSATKNKPIHTSALNMVKQEIYYGLIWMDMSNSIIVCFKKNLKYWTIPKNQRVFPKNQKFPKKMNRGSPGPREIWHFISHPTTQISKKFQNLEHYPKIKVFPKNQKFPKNWAEVPLAQGQFGISFHILQLKFPKIPKWSKSMTSFFCFCWRQLRAN